MKTCVGDLEAAVKEGNQEKVEVAKQRLLAEGKLTLEQGGIKCGNRGTGFLDSEGSHR